MVPLRKRTGYNTKYSHWSSSFRNNRSRSLLSIFPPLDTISCFGARVHVQVYVCVCVRVFYFSIIDSYPFMIILDLKDQFNIPLCIPEPVLTLWLIFQDLPVRVDGVNSWWMAERTVREDGGLAWSGASPLEDVTRMNFRFVSLVTWNHPSPCLPSWRSLSSPRPLLRAAMTASRWIRGADPATVSAG